MTKLDDSLKQWTQFNQGIGSAYSSQSATSAIVRTRILLYTGDGPAAWQFIAGEWPILKKHYYLRVGGMRQWLHYEKGQSALAASFAAEDPKTLLRVADRAARDLERDEVPYAHAIALLIRAGCASRRGNNRSAMSLLEQAIPQLERGGLMIVVAAARRTLGELTDGEAGRELISGADRAMQAEGVQDPPRFAAMVVNGFRQPTVWRPADAPPRRDPA